MALDRPTQDLLNQLAEGDAKPLEQMTPAEARALGRTLSELYGRGPEVASFGRCHDIPNLFIVDGSVMVTSGGMNPTATIAALALRSAQHIAATAHQQRVPA